MEKIKSSRKYSFIAVGIIYLLATAIGILTFELLDLSMPLSLLIADTVATVFVFIFSLIFKNASVYDPYWSVAPIVIVIYASIKSALNFYTVILMLAVCLWGIRLTMNWAYTFKGLNFQDWRYTMLHKNTKNLYPVINFVGIHMVPTLVVYACIAPAAYAICEGLEYTPLSIAFVLVSVAAFTIQAIADCQMHSFKKNGKGGFIRVGLWKSSRHPNYLGEIIMWWSVGLSVFFASGKIIMLLGAFLNTLLFVFVSIPMAENKQSAKAGYSEYKRETRVLLPINKKQRTNK